MELHKLIVNAVFGSFPPTGRSGKICKRVAANPTLWLLKRVGLARPLRKAISEPGRRLGEGFAMVAGPTSPIQNPSKSFGSSERHHYSMAAVPQLPSLFYDCKKKTYSLAHVEYFRGVLRLRKGAPIINVGERQVTWPGKSTTVWVVKVS